MQIHPCISRSQVEVLLRCCHQECGVWYVPATLGVLGSRPAAAAPRPICQSFVLVGLRWKVSGGYLRYVTSYLGGQFANLCGLGASAPTATTSYDKRRGPVDLVEELVVGAVSEHIHLSSSWRGQASDS